MLLPEQAVAEFQAIYAEEFGREISETEAREMAQNLINLAFLLLKNNGAH